MKLLYLIGEPGIGKTTIAKELFDGVPGEVRTVPYVAWTHYHPKLAQLGKDREEFGGTDALGMAAQKHVIRWLEEECDYEFIFAEGDRLANGKFFDWAKDYGADLTVVVLWNPELAEERRTARNEELGKEQNEKWIASRRTKVQNLMDDYANITLDPAKYGKGKIAQSIMYNTAVGKAIRKVRRLRRNNA